MSKKSYVIGVMFFLFGGCMAQASYDEYMYYSMLEVNQNQGVSVREVPRKYDTFKEKTNDGITERMFNRNNYEMVRSTDYDKKGHIKRISEVYKFVELSSKDNCIHISLYYDNDKSEKHRYIAFDENDNLPKYIMSDGNNSLKKLDANEALHGVSVITYRDNQPLKMFLQLQNKENQKLSIYLNYTNGQLLTKNEYLYLK